MTLYMVEIEETRRAVQYIRADTQGEAEMAARELVEAAGKDAWVDEDLECSARAIVETRVAPGGPVKKVTREVWSGGPKGKYTEEEIPASARPWFDLP